MCKRFLILTSFALVLGLVGSASAVLNYEYYEAPGQYNALADVEFGVATPVRVGTSDTLNSGDGDWTLQAGGHREDDFAFRFFGYIVIPVSGETTFYTRSDDGSQLFINGQLVVDNDGLHGASAFPGVSGAITLDAGAYTIEAIQFERGGGDSIYVNWSHGGFGARSVPDSVLFLEAPADISVVPPTVLVRLKAADPAPVDGAIDSDATALEWTSGYGAVSHKVYLSTDETIDEADLIGETGLNIQVVTLDPGATYYWRVDEIDADGNVAESDVWSFTTLPLEAHFPSPADGATNAISVTLSWTPGKDAIMHNVHFGTDPAMLLPVQMMSMETSYDPGALDPGTTYYWRVDEFTPLGTVAGPVWSLSTIGEVTAVEEPNLVAFYPLDEDSSSLAALDRSGNDNHGMLVGALSFVDDPEMGRVLSLPGGDNQFVDCGSVGISGTMPRTIACWAKADHTSIPDWTLIFGFTGNADGGGGSGSHFNIGSLGGPGGVGAHCWGWEETIFSDQQALEWRHYAMTYDGTTIQYYGDGQLVDTDPGKSNVRDLSASADRVHIGSRITQGSSFPGKVADARVYDTVLGIENIRILAGVEELPYGPAPADGAIDLDASGVVLTWNPALDAVEQDVYLGTNEAAVADANATDTTGIYLGRQAETEAALDDLNRGVTYFWKVDGVKADGTVMPGIVWNFRIVDRNTENWAAGVDADYLNTYVRNGAYDIGTFGGEMTYEFIVNANPDVTPSSALIGRIGHGDTTAALKYEQWNDTGNYGATVFGVMDYDYGVATAPGEYTHLAFVSSETAGTTELYVNGELAGSIPSAITLSGTVGIGQAIRDPEGIESIDNFDGTIFGVAIYDRLLTADEIAGNADKYFSPIPIGDPDLLIHYNFESGEGSLVLDRSGHGNHGEFVGTPEWVSGMFGGAVSIVKEDVDYIQTAAPLGIVSNTVSVTGWVKHDALPEAWSGILTHRGTSPGNVGLQHDGTELRYMWGADAYWDFSSGLAIPVGEWYFAALTISPDQGKLYLNGTDQTAVNVAPHELTNFDTPIYVGGDPANNINRIMTSLIDEVTFYNRTLTDLEIQSMLNGGTAPLYGEDFESYAVGTDLHGVNDWEGWEGTAGAGAPVSDAGAVSGLNSVEIISTADLVKKLDITGGQVTLTAMQYIPSGTTGDTFFILMNQYAPNPLDWSCQTKFSLGSGQINDGGGTIVYDQWVELKYVIDLDNNTVDEYYDGIVIRSGQWNVSGHNTLQAIDLYSAGASSVYYDDIVIEPTKVIAWVSYHAGDDEPHADAAAHGFTQAPDIGYTDLLKAQGYNVVRVLTSKSPDVEYLNTMDLVIISRTASSGHYSGSGASLWNSVTAPMINLNGYTLRSSRMGFTDGGTMEDTTGDVQLTVTDPNHPIFAGIDLLDGTMVNMYAEGAVPLPTDPTIISNGISINDNNIDDDGTLLATIAEVSADTGPAGGMVIAEWSGGATMQNSSGSPDDVLGGSRLVFLTGSREPAGVTGGQAAALYDLYPDGEQMLLNAVAYMLR